MKVIVKLVLFCIVLDISYAARLSRIQNEDSTKVEVRNALKTLHADKDYALETSIVGILILTVAKTVWSLMSTVWSIAAFKLTAVAVATKSLIWFVRNGFTVVIGAVLMYGFCIITDKCSSNKFPYVHGGLIPIIPQEALAQAELTLRKGTETYEDTNLVPKYRETLKADSEEDLVTS